MVIPLAMLTWIILSSSWLLYYYKHERGALEQTILLVEKRAGCCDEATFDWDSNDATLWNQLRNSTPIYTYDVHTTDTWLCPLEKKLYAERQERMADPVLHFNSVRTAFVTKYTQNMLVRNGPPKELRLREQENGCVLPSANAKNEWSRFVAAALRRNRSGVSESSTSSSEGTSSELDEIFQCGSFTHRSISCYNKVFMGLVMAWNADILFWDAPTTDGSCSTEQFARALDAYDLVIVIDSFIGISPKRFPPRPKHQIRLWMPSEPGNLENASYSDGAVQWSNMPTDFCKVLLDNFVLDRSAWRDGFPETHPFWYHYRNTEFRAAFHCEHQHHRDNRRVWLMKHGEYEIIEEQLQRRGFETRHAAYTMKDYFEALSCSKYVIVPELHRSSSGQVIPDAVITSDVPVFCPRNRWFARLLQPPFMSYQTLDELFQKIDLLERDPCAYDSIQRAVAQRRRFLDTSWLESPVQLIRRFQTTMLGREDENCFPSSVTKEPVK